eukprot:12274360-Alexandrium_andersonii.AAC.1
MVERSSEFQGLRPQQHPPLLQRVVGKKPLAAVLASQHRWKPYALAASLVLGQAQGARDDALTLYVPFQDFGRELLLLLAV